MKKEYVPIHRIKSGDISITHYGYQDLVKDPLIFPLKINYVRKYCKSLAFALFFGVDTNFFYQNCISYKPQTIIDDNITFFQAGFQ